MTTTGVPLHPTLPADAFTLYRDAVPDLERMYLEVLGDFMADGLPRPMQLRGERMARSYEFGSEAVSAVAVLEEAAGLSADERAKKGRPYPPSIAYLAGLVTAKCGRVPEMCLVQLYRTGDDHVGYHIDAPAVTGPTADAPELYIFSFGAERSMGVRPIGDSAGILGEPRVSALPHGSLLRLAGAAHREWEHSILEEPTQRQLRVSVSFGWRQRSPESEIPWMIARGNNDDGDPVFVGPEASAVRVMRELEEANPEESYTLVTSSLRTYGSSTIYDYDRAINHPDERKEAVLRAFVTCGQLIGQYPEYFDAAELRAALPPQFLGELRAELALDLATEEGANADRELLDTLEGLRNGPGFEDLPRARKDYILAALPAMQWWIAEGNAGRHPRVPAFTACDGIILRWLDATGCGARKRLSVLRAISHQLDRMLDGGNAAD